MHGLAHWGLAALFDSARGAFFTVVLVVLLGVGAVLVVVNLSAARAPGPAPPGPGSTLAGPAAPPPPAAAPDTRRFEPIDADDGAPILPSRAPRSPRAPRRRT